MAMDYEGSPKDYRKKISFAGDIFSYVFISEAALNLCIFGP